jgi:hypothetical protein
MAPPSSPMTAPTVKFTLPPRKSPSTSQSPTPTPDSEASKGPLSFALDYSRIRARLPLDPDASESAWKEFDSNLSYNSLLSELSQLPQTDSLSKLFDTSSKEKLPIFERLRPFLTHFPSILPINSLVTFVSFPILDPRELFKIIPKKSVILFSSAISIIHSVLRKVRSLEVQQQLVFEFAKSLLPLELVKRETERSFIKYLLCLPLTTSEGRFFWILVSRDQIGTLVPADGCGEPIIRSLKEFIARDKSLSISGQSYRFGSDRGWELFQNCDFKADPLITFLSCFKDVVTSPSRIPTEFTKQLIDAIGSPGQTLANGICTAISQTRRDCLAAVLAGLGYCETLTTFLRTQYTNDISLLRDHTRIFRDNSIGMASTGVLLRAHGTVLVPELTEVLVRESESKPVDVLIRWLPVLNNMPQFNRVLLRFAFLAARRKFSDRLIPITALGGMTMLRFVMPDVGEKAPNLTKLLQQMMQITVFSPAARNEADSATFMAVAEALTDLTRLRGNYVPRNNFSPQNLAELITVSLDEIKAALKPLNELQLHPFVYSLQEFIETIFMGPDEDPKRKLAGAVLF